MQASWGGADPLRPPSCLDATDRGRAGTPPCMFISNRRPLLHRVVGEGGREEVMDLQER